MIDWRKICVPNSAITAAPIEHDGYIYMTDGHRAFRFDRDVELLPFQAQCEATKCAIDNLISIFFGIESLIFADLPDFVVPNRALMCGVCNGTGLAALCDECDGTGGTECSECGHEQQCNNCVDGFVFNPDAPQVRCENCRGSGVSIPKYTITKFGNTGIDYRYLVSVQAFGNVRVAFYYDPLKPIIFKFTGGYAAVLPMRC